MRRVGAGLGVKSPGVTRRARPGLSRCLRIRRAAHRQLAYYYNVWVIYRLFPFRIGVSHKHFIKRTLLKVHIIPKFIAKLTCYKELWQQFQKFLFKFDAKPALSNWWACFLTIIFYTYRKQSTFKTYYCSCSNSKSNEEYSLYYKLFK